MKVAVIFLVSMIAAVSASYDEKDYATYTFAHTFGKILRSNPDVCKVFDITLVPEKEAGPIYQKALTEFYKSVGAKNPEALGKELGDAVSKNLHKLSPEDKAIDIGYNLANSLKALGKLDDQNAKQQAKDAAADFEKEIKKNDISSPEGKLEGLLAGYRAVFERFGVNIADYAQKIVDNASKIIQ